MDIQDLKRFMEKIEFEPNSGCWLWTGRTDRKGYGCFFLNGKGNKFAHRISFIIHHKINITNKLICHKCDNPTCVNPEHLFLGTYKDNHDDMRRKKRSRSDKITKCPKGHDYIDGNIYLTKNGHRVCRICKNKKSKDYYAKRSSGITS